MIRKWFISYRADEEGTRYKNTLKMWSANDSATFDLKFGDTSIGTSINSTDAAYIKKRIIEKIKESNNFICLVGENTHSSAWVNWEIEKAYELGKKIVAIKINNNYTTPLSLYGKGAKWAKSFTLESIKKAVDD